MSWRDAAACKSVDPEVFFPERGESVAKAKKVCSGCPVKAECLEFAETELIKHGVWGGLSERQRRIRRREVDRLCELCGEPCATKKNRWCVSCHEVGVRGREKVKNARRYKTRAALEARTA